MSVLVTVHAAGKLVGSVRIENETGEVPIADYLATYTPTENDCTGRPTARAMVYGFDRHRGIWSLVTDAAQRLGLWTPAAETADRWLVIAQRCSTCGSGGLAKIFDHKPTMVDFGDELGRCVTYRAVKIPAFGECVQVPADVN